MYVPTLQAPALQAPALQACARDNPELLHRVADCLMPPDVIALAHSCTHACALRTHEAFQHARAMAPSLRAIRRIEYRIAAHSYDRDDSNRWTICANILSIRDDVTYIAVSSHDTIRPGLYAEYLSARNHVTRRVIWINAFSSTLRTGCDVYDEIGNIPHWMGQRLRLPDVIEHCHTRISRYLSRPHKRALAHTCHALHWYRYYVTSISWD